MDDFLARHPLDKNHFFATTKTETPYFDAPIPYKGFVYFGAEDEGLPLWLLGTYPNQCVTIPMKEEFRSLNLASSVAIITYDVVRQHFHTKGLE
jgi:tRNA (cytidine/uridine-2'-O-)-methyltransferase